MVAPQHQFQINPSQIHDRCRKYANGARMKTGDIANLNIKLMVNVFEKALQTGGADP